MPSVKFAPSVDEDRPSQKRRRDEESESGAAGRGDSILMDDDSPKKQKKLRSNEDELDDLDDWKEEDDEDDKNGVLPSEKELLEAKRQRRQNRNALDADGKTKIDDMTSLAAEGIQVEPFHMKNEESDGTGFFDGDTYVFRKHNVEEGEDEEPDAWLDRLREDEEEGKKSLYQAPVAKPKTAETPSKESMDDLTKEQLYRKILPLLNEKESVSQALIRYGRLIKPARGAKGVSADASQLVAQSSAKGYLNEVTGAANALLLRGEVEIYQATKPDIERFLPTSQFQTPAGTKRLIEKQPPAKWEYQGNQDGVNHGPYTTEQMLEWVKAGYFVGAQRVKIRTIREGQKEVSTQEDLLADLLDDDDEEDNGDAKSERVLVKGEWQWSNEVDFGAYLPLPNC